jgi:hypothetical protein
LFFLNIDNLRLGLRCRIGSSNHAVNVLLQVGEKILALPRCSHLRSIPQLTLALRIDLRHQSLLLVAFSRFSITRALLGRKLGQAQRFPGLLSLELGKPQRLAAFGRRLLALPPRRWWRWSGRWAQWQFGIRVRTTTRCIWSLLQSGGVAYFVGDCVHGIGIDRHGVVIKLRFFMSHD